MERMISPGRNLRVAIVGTGMIGAVHLRAARAAGASVVGVLGSSIERSRQMARAWNVPQGYEDFDALLADKPDVVHICSPNDTHVDYAVLAMERAINVVCEKPVATTADDAHRLLQAYGSAGVIGTVPFVYRYHPLVRELAARRKSGEFGDINLIHGSYLQDWMIDPLTSSWRVDSTVGGESRAFADIGSHWCDIAEFITGERFATVSAVTSIAYKERPGGSGSSFARDDRTNAPLNTVTTEDIAIATFTTEMGIPANVVVSQVAAGRKNRLWIEIDGAKASAVFDQETPNSLWIGREHESSLIQRAESNASAAQARLNSLPAGHAEGYADAFASFVSDTYCAVNGIVNEGLPTLVDGVRASTIARAVMESTKGHKATIRNSTLHL